MLLTAKAIARPTDCPKLDELEVFILFISINLMFYFLQPSYKYKQKIKKPLGIDGNRA